MKSQCLLRACRAPMFHQVPAQFPGCVSTEGWQGFDECMVYAYKILINESDIRWKRTSA